MQIMLVQFTARKSYYIQNKDSHTSAPTICSTCFPEPMPREAHKKTKDSKSGEEYFGRESSYKETNKQKK